MRRVARAPDKAVIVWFGIRVARLAGRHTLLQGAGRCTTASASSSTAASTGPARASRWRRGTVRRHVLRHDRTGARQPHTAVVLSVGVHPVGAALIDRHPIHLPDRQRDAGVAGGIRRRSENAHFVVAGHNVVAGHRRRRVPPDVMAVAAAAAPRHPDLSAVARPPQGTVGDQHMVGIIRRYADANVVAGATDQAAIPARVAPRLSAVVGSPQRSLRFRLQPLHAVGTGLNEGVHAVAVRRRDRDVGFAVR